MSCVQVRYASDLSGETDFSWQEELIHIYHSDSRLSTILIGGKPAGGVEGVILYFITE